MTKIRTVKPELFIHEELFDAEQASELPLRLAFIGLFCCCDAKGRFRWRPRELKTKILPYDPVDMAQVLHALEQAGFILKYVVNEKAYGWIPSWEQHQRINSREMASQLPSHDPPSSSVPMQKLVNAKPSTHTNQIKAIFEHWKTTMACLNAKLDKKRCQAIEQALRAGYSVEQLYQAITGCKNTPYNMGDNPQGQCYNNLSLILSDSDHIERFIKHADKPPKYSSQSTTKNLNHLKHWKPKENDYGNQ